jgi:TRAP-type C4-dicarboxylate transport system permease small subunit
MKLTLNKIDFIFQVLEEYILVITGSAVTLMILANALFRALQIDWFGSEELTLFVAVWLYFIGGICAGRDNTHICGNMLDMFISNKKIIFIFDVLKNVLSIAMASVFSVWIYEFVLWQGKLHSTTAVFKLPIVISLIPIAVFFTFWVIYLIRDLVVLVQNGPERKEERDTEKGDEVA